MNRSKVEQNEMKKCCCCSDQPEQPEENVLCCPSGSPVQEKQTRIVPRIATQLTRADKWGNIKVRWGFKRMNYKVDPGIYAVGNPDENAIVLVSANYKLSFDALRKELTGLDAWILVLDTRGINVWCAAGKGTFGTDELVRRIEITGLKEIVKHRKLIVPQLGAPGISAHRVKTQSGFNIPAFLQGGMKATPEMRQVQFTLRDRARVVPIELVMGMSKLLLIMLAFFALSGLNSSGYSMADVTSTGLRAVLALLLAYIAGVVGAPLLLPWLPGRSFSFKGFTAGVLFFVPFFFVVLRGIPLLETTAWFLLISTFSSFLTMNFTGASTYTSLSGVEKEMHYAFPAQITTASIGILLWLAGRFV
jgi:hypothetical protein